MGDYRLEYKQTSNTSPRSNFGASSKPKGITIHHWGADGQTHSGVVNWLRGANGNTSNRGSSAHYVVSSGLVTQLAADTVATWHAGHRQGNGEDIGIEMRPEMSAGDWGTLVQLCADLEEEHGSLRYRRHSDWKATACPGRYSSRMQELVDAVNAEHKRRGNEGLAGGGKPAPSSGSSGASSGGSSGGSKSVSQMASEVIAGQHGTGHANRRRSLGVSASVYEQVRAEVNRRAGGGSSPSSSRPAGKSVAQMAQEVIDGRHGNGHANRRRSLGVSQAVYEQVRAEVNRRASGGSSRPAGKSISQMATEVLRGDHGNGHAQRRRSLGVNAATYAKVRAEVNRRA